MLGIAGEVWTKALSTSFDRLLHMNTLVPADQQKLSFISCMRTLDAVLIGLVWFGSVLRHIKHCRLLNANRIYTYILNIYDLFYFVLVLWHINHCILFNAKSIFKHFNSYISKISF